MVCLGQDGRSPLLISRRIRAQIEGHIKNRTTCTADELCLCKGCNLIVHTAQSALAQAAGNVALHQSGAQSTGCELLLAPRAGKESSVVMDKLGTNLEDSGYLGCKKHHMVD